MGMEMAMMTNSSRSRIGISRCGTDTDRAQNILSDSRNGRRNVQPARFFGMQERPSKIEGKTRKRPIRADLQAAQFQRIDLGNIHTWDGGYSGTIPAARKHFENCRAAIGGFAEGKGKIQDGDAQFFLQQAFGGPKLLLQFLRRQLAYDRMTERVRSKSNSGLVHDVNLFPGQNAIGK